MAAYKYMEIFLCVITLVAMFRSVYVTDQLFDGSFF